MQTKNKPSRYGSAVDGITGMFVKGGKELMFINEARDEGAKSCRDIDRVGACCSKPGDCSGLVSAIGSICGDQLKAGLEGLEPEAMTDVFGKFVQRLAQMYCLRPSG